eukprot:958166-Rhodomonas_salina.1
MDEATAAESLPRRQFVLTSKAPKGLCSTITITVFSLHLGTLLHANGFLIPKRPPLFISSVINVIWQRQTQSQQRRQPNLSHEREQHCRELSK